MRLAIVIPCYNVELVIKKTIYRILVVKIIQLLRILFS